MRDPQKVSTTQLAQWVKGEALSMLGLGNDKPLFQIAAYYALRSREAASRRSSSHHKSQNIKLKAADVLATAWIAKQERGDRANPFEATMICVDKKKHGQ